MIQLIGYAGLILLAMSYVFLYKDEAKMFYLINIPAGMFLTLYAVILGDLIFIIVNGGIVILNSIKLWKMI